MILLLLGVVAGSAGMSALAIRLLRPWLLAVALARPNARSSHRVPTPQGGGLAVMGATLVGAATGLWWAGQELQPVHLAITGGSLTLAALGFRDDVRPLSAGLRLLAQFACTGLLVVLAGDPGAGGFGVPVVLAYLLLTVLGVWWVNLVNFMDGIDWMTVAQMAPLTACICGLGACGFVGPAIAIAAAALLGGLLGFAPANRPVARLFLGDAGSLPIGLLTGWMLLELARTGGLAAALLVSLYYGADATLTLALRARRGEPLASPHRSHFYQRAIDNGWSVLAVVGRVLALNLALALLATATLRWPSRGLELSALGFGAVLVALTLRAFSGPRPGQSPAGGSRLVAGHDRASAANPSADP